VSNPNFIFPAGGNIHIILIKNYRNLFMVKGYPGFINSPKHKQIAYDIYHGFYCTYFSNQSVLGQR